MAIYRFAVNLLIVLWMITCVKAGVCWKKVTSSGKCADIYKWNMDQETCCSVTNYLTGWSAHIQLSESMLSFWTLRNNVDSGAPMCHRCHNTCNKVKCPSGQRCRMRHGLPKCVCAVKCRRKHLVYKGKVCGINRRTYRHRCHLAKFNCRKNLAINVVYESSCKRSCKDVKCLHGKHCTEDQNGLPHCVNCDRCPVISNYREQRPLCGSDGKTYQSLCALRKRSCIYDIRLKIAYDGPCKPNQTCHTLSCGRKRCLVDPVTSAPRCVSCTNIYCSANIFVKHTICGTDGVTYNSFCDLQREACQTGVDIRTHHSGSCQVRVTDKTKVVISKKYQSKRNRRKQKRTSSKQRKAKRAKLRLRKPLPIT